MINCDRNFLVIAEIVKPEYHGSLSKPVTATFEGHSWTTWVKTYKYKVQKKNNKPSILQIQCLLNASKIERKTPILKVHLHVYVYTDNFLYCFDTMNANSDKLKSKNCLISLSTAKCNSGFQTFSDRGTLKMLHCCSKQMRKCIVIYGVTEPI